MKGSSTKVMISLRLDQDVLDAIDDYVRYRGFRSRREVLSTAFEEFHAIRSVDHTMQEVTIRLPRTVISDLNRLVDDLGDANSREEFIITALKTYIDHRFDRLRSRIKEAEDVKHAIKVAGRYPRVEP